MSVWHSFFRKPLEIRLYLLAIGGRQAAGVQSEPFWKRGPFGNVTRRSHSLDLLQEPNKVGVTIRCAKELLNERKRLLTIRRVPE